MFLSVLEKLSQQNIKVEELEGELQEMRNIYQQETGRHRMSLEEKVRKPLIKILHFEYYASIKYCKSDLTNILPVYIMHILLL